jgi:hypothetical protein
MLLAGRDSDEKLVEAARRSYGDESGLIWGMKRFRMSSTVGEKVKCARTGDLAKVSYICNGAAESKKLSISSARETTIAEGLHGQGSDFGQG